jgi:hypothetical protein
MKFCIDCRHRDGDSGDPEFSLCKHPAAAKRTISLVTSAEEIVYPFCSVERKQGLDDCGPDANLWEPKEEAA